MSNQGTSARTIDLRIRTVGGHEHETQLAEDSTELRELFTAFVNRPSSATAARPGLVQLPLDGGAAACTIAVDQIVSIATSPPVLVQLDQPSVPPENVAAPAPQTHREPATLHHPEVVVIDDFLGVDEHADLVAYALRERERFEPGTVEGRPHHARRNSVIMSFTSSAHSALLVNRLLIWYPLIAQALEQELFPLKMVESQLTASNDGDFYNSHMDTDGAKPDDRVIACVYYFYRDPKGFSGGDLRMYDMLDSGHGLRRANTFQTIEPANNRLVAFTAKTFHELRPIRCPSKEFEDSRFAITNWIHRTSTPDTASTFGWGHFHCGTVAQGLTSMRTDS